MINWKTLSDESRVWLYMADRKLLDDEAAIIKKEGAVFVEEWTAHGSQLKASIEVFYNRFVVLFADESQAQASGCSIDKSMHFIKAIEQELDVSLTNRLLVPVKVDGEIESYDRDAFERKFKNQEFPENARTFNNLIDTKGALENHWEIPLEESWAV